MTKWIHIKHFNEKNIKVINAFHYTENTHCIGQNKVLKKTAQNQIKVLNGTEIHCKLCYKNYLIAFQIYKKVTNKLLKNW